MNLLNNRYRVLRELGAGGFGNTYLAEDTQMPSQRYCVIKKLKPTADDPRIHQLITERFAREAAVLERLGENSRQIPKLYAYFTEAGQFYLVQEWIDGTTLTKKVEGNGVLKEPEVREILVSLLSVLTFVHTQGIVHRDIKPDNIILRSEDRQPVLIDFGAVRETLATQINSQGRATNSIVIGTPGFMPPEQAAGRPVYSSDLYSLALTAIYLLTGKMPQDLDTDPITGEIIWSQPGISPTLASVLDKAAKSHPRDRFASAPEMLNALRSGSIAQPNPNVGASPPRLPTPQGSNPVASSIPTIPIAPPGSQPTPVVAENKPNWLLISSLVLVGAIGSSMVLGSIVNRNAQKQRLERSPQPVVASSPSPAPDLPPDEETSPQPTESSTPSPAPDSLPDEETSPQPPVSLTPTPSPTPPASASPASLSLVFPKYAPNALPTTPRFARCLQGEVLYMVGEMANSRFAICGVDENPPRTPTGYLAYDKKTGELNRAEFRDNRFFKLDPTNNRLYAYDPPSYSQGTYNNPVVGVYRDGRLLQNVRILKLYKKG